MLRKLGVLIVMLMIMFQAISVEARKKCIPNAKYTGRVDRVVRDGGNGKIIFFDLWTTKNSRGYYQVIVSELLYGLLLESGKVKLLRVGNRVTVRAGGCGEYPAEIMADESWDGITAARK